MIVYTVKLDGIKEFANGLLTTTKIGKPGFSYLYSCRKLDIYYYISFSLDQYTHHGCYANKFSAVVLSGCLGMYLVEHSVNDATLWLLAFKPEVNRFMSPMTYIRYEVMKCISQRQFFGNPHPTGRNDD